MATDLTTLGIAVESSGVEKATKNLEQMAKAGDGAASSATNLEGSMTGAVTKGNLLASAIEKTVTLAFEATGAFIRLGLAVGDYQDLALKTGSDPAGLAKLKTAADMSGTSVESVALAMNRLTQSLDGAEGRSSRAERALKNLNINVEEFKKLGADAQYRMLAEQFEKFADGTTKASNAQALFGRGGAEQLIVMRNLIQAGERQNSLTNEQIKAADDLSDRIAQMRSEMQQYVQLVAVDALPALDGAMRAAKGIFEALVDVSSEGGTLSREQVITEWAEGVAYAGGTAADMLASIVRVAYAVAGSIKVVINDIKAMGSYADMWNPARGGIAGYLMSDKRQADHKALLAEREADLVEANRRYEAIMNADYNKYRDIVRKAFADMRKERAPAPFSDSRFESERKGVLGDVGGGDDKPKAAKGVDEITRAMNSLNEELALFGQSDIDKKLLKFQLMGASAKQIEEYRAQLEQLGKLQAYEATQKMATALQDEAIRLQLTGKEYAVYKAFKEGATWETARQIAANYDLVESLKAEQKAISNAEALLARAITPTERYLKALQDIAVAESKGKMSPEDANKARAIAGQDLEKSAERGKKAIEEMDEFAKQASRNIQDSLGSTLEQMLSGNFDNIGNLWASMIRKMIAEAMAAQLAQALMGDFGKTGKLGGIFGDIVGAFSGGVSPGTGLEGLTPTDLSFFYADGGRPPVGRVSVVGEKGPELFVADQPGTIIPNGFGGGQSIVINSSPVIKIDSRTDQAQIAGIVSRAMEQNNTALLENLRTAGAY